MTRRVFFSFHYKPDAWRVAQVRSIGSIEGNTPANDNDWETVISQSEASIKNWIANQMQGRSCVVVLVGAQTAHRKWIRYEIVEAWNKGMGVVGIRIHGLQDQSRQVSIEGHNPFDYIQFNGNSLSSVVKCYNPGGSTSKERYDWIQRHLSAAIEESIRIRQRY